jgi:hypothetical protein
VRLESKPIDGGRSCAPGVLLPAVLELLGLVLKVRPDLIAGPDIDGLLVAEVPGTGRVIP